LALDGLQPDVGHEVLWVLRDCLSGAVLLARSLLSATQPGLTGGNMRPAAISSIAFFDTKLVAHCMVDERSTEFPKKSSTGNFSPNSPCPSTSGGHLHRESASAEM
jgi:hypothetical protein